MPKAPHKILNLLDAGSVVLPDQSPMELVPGESIEELHALDLTMPWAGDGFFPLDENDLTEEDCYPSPHSDEQ